MTKSRVLASAKPLREPLVCCEGHVRDSWQTGPDCLERIGGQLPDYLKELYKSFGNALDRFHDEPEFRLPLPARYLIDREGIIRAADVNADYTRSPEPSETVRQLRMLPV